ncbi:MAG: 2OG-Fe(II) oxygenase [Gammaproteobacteria bacterium]|nr:2OG-Fe(II) oxygenase [Gammaproteobacteria bacterium]
MANMGNILSALTDISQQGSFCARQTASCEGLQIKIKGFPTNAGKLKLPLSARATKSLIRLARPAKFGWQDQTLLDPQVRDVWEVPKSKVQIDNRVWNKTLNPLLEQFKAELGLSAGGKLKAHLHNLLIYEPGQFFKPHQDSEKVDGMVASLVVVLPSSYRGGMLVVDHQGEKKRFQAPRATGDKLTLIAFYADCHHEVRPVTEGYRITLTYNLVLDNSNRTASPVQSAATVDALASGLRRYFHAPATRDESDGSGKTTQPRKWVYLLGHEYTKKSLYWDRLKNEDQPRVDALRVASDALGLERYLALADIQEIWDAEEEDSRRDYGYRRRGYWYDEYDDDNEEEKEDEAISADEYILHDLIDSDITLQHLIDENNRQVDIGGLRLSDEEICWTRDTDDFDPFNTEYEGYMGNYGNTLERWYHRAAVILWRKEDHFAVLCELDANRAAGEILRLAKKKTTLPEARMRVESILPYWVRHARWSSDGKLAATAYKLALQIQSAEQAQLLLSPLGLASLTPGTAQVLVALEKTYDTPWCLSVFESWSKPAEHDYRRPEAIPQLSSIVRILMETSKGQCGLMKWLLNFQYATLKEDHDSRKAHSSLVYLKRDEPSRTKQISDLLQAGYHAGQPTIHQQTLDYVINNPVLFSRAALADILLHRSKMLKDTDFKAWGYGHLLNHAVAQLEARIAKGNREQDDWSIETASTCGCEDCKQLNAFLSSRTTTVLTWPLNKERRRHIHGTIDGMGVPVTHNTRREGSPHKLILTKTEKLFTRDQQELEDTRARLTKLRALA